MTDEEIRARLAAEAVFDDHGYPLIGFGRRPTITARQLLRDVDALVVNAELDVTVALHIRNALNAIAAEIRELKGTGSRREVVSRHDVLSLVDPSWMDDVDYAALGAAAADEERH